MGWVSLDSVSLDLLVFLCTFKKATPFFSPGYRLDFGCQYVFLSSRPYTLQGCLRRGSLLWRLLHVFFSGHFSSPKPPFFSFTCLASTSGYRWEVPVTKRNAAHEMNIRKGIGAQGLKAGVVLSLYISLGHLPHDWNRLCFAKFLSACHCPYRTRAGLSTHLNLGGDEIEAVPPISNACKSQTRATNTAGNGERIASPPEPGAFLVMVTVHDGWSPNDKDSSGIQNSAEHIEVRQAIPTSRKRLPGSESLELPSS